MNKNETILEYGKALGELKSYNNIDRLFYDENISSLSDLHKIIENITKDKLNKFDKLRLTLLKKGVKI